MNEYMVIGLFVAALVLGLLVYLFVQPFEWCRHKRSGPYKSVKQVRNHHNFTVMRIAYESGDMRDVDPWVLWLPQDPADAALAKKMREQKAAEEAKKAGKKLATKDMPAAKPAMPSQTPPPKLKAVQKPAPATPPPSTQKPKMSDPAIRIHKPEGEQQA